MPPISILQLEDSRLDVDLQLMFLRRAGIAFQNTHVQTRAEFNRALAHLTFDLILADYYLPAFNGMEALAIAREKAPRTPFIFVSGVLGEEIAIDSLRNGATDYVLKMRMERLVPAVQRAIAQAAERQELRRMESALVESENRFRHMADFAPVMIWTADCDQRWNYCNRPWLEFSGLTLEQSSGSGWTRLLHPQDVSRVRQVYDLAFETREEFTLEYRLLRADRKYRSIVNRAVPRTGNENAFAGFIGSCTDITELKAAEARRLLSLGVLASGIAHDFNNLLTSIMGNAALALEQLPSSPASRLLEAALAAAETAAKLTNQMLTYSGKSYLVLREVEFSRAVREAMLLIEASAPPLVEVKLELAGDLPTVKADPAQVRQLIINLVINASEAAAMRDGGVVIISTSAGDLTEVDAAAMLSGFPAPPGPYVMLRVRDNGPGMDDVTRSHIFDPFFSTKFTGRGLGLAAVSGIVSGHRGGIVLESEPGKGADFRVYFPLDPTTLELAPLNPAALAASAAPQNSWPVDTRN